MEQLAERAQAFASLMDSTAAGSIFVNNTGAFVADFEVSYDYQGQRVTQDTGGFTAGESKIIYIPAGATNIYLVVKEAVFIHCWSDIFSKNFDTPVEKKYHVWGTTLSPKWEEID